MPDSTRPKIPPEAPIDDPPQAGEPIVVYEDRSRANEDKISQGSTREKPTDGGNDEETMPIEEGFSIVP